MAITYVGMGSADSTSGIPTARIPAGIAAGDKLILLWTGRHDDDHSTGAGSFVKLGEITTGGVTTSDSKLSVWTKTATGSETDFSWVDGGNHNLIRMMAVRGDDTLALGTPATSSRATASTSQSLVGITTNHDNCMVIACFGGGLNAAGAQSGAANSDLVSATIAIDNYTTSGSDSTITSVYGIDTTAGSVGTTSLTTNTAMTMASLTFEVYEVSAGTDVSPGGRQTLGRQSAAVAATKLGGVLQ